ncbi:MAG: acylneuraminate cytidylyltransferase family protein [Pseudodesulfovibrio sp.]|uniref:Acylneuraminate cytidylyltransferase n=1 Tax=Pseudodesulfovibrio aespoeensis (strain ATCC 700646 / DSM 10631 / Aspo-2) TaxID=643562 RepID=E6VUI1_PSEA9|nr:MULTISPECIES: acylneuraminate cytidylyltransferase family protein [Pseudodesulfovibrio]MBU4379189.1 acylneuraminate cytidylyltransferase family protein [Pseudomonadota bacterium]ADU61126.1 acylneuraminate cytidylyltransferase [Pseudodesulfovibrio aespoeensis Aspo-2]MBU4476741.1 acylneuraminate cytidylyltransferase family protein [Pseudomonadota bacterium]MBU4517063.1 acylneuraminate cytidylyltransferase family protein [Pseudomonadota bacterium]MBU4520881.1 acylneuraminate cytidylyltransfera
MNATLKNSDPPVLFPRVKRLAFIPARGGSKGLRRKNVLDLCGQPLIAHTIQAALACGGFDRVFVSTDDEEIAEVSRSFGADVPFLRPKEHARDDSLLAGAINHAFKEFENRGESFHLCAELYPTSPFRTPDLLRMLLSKLDAGYKSVRTAHTSSGNATRYYICDGQDERPLTPVWPNSLHGSLFFLGVFNGYWISPLRPTWGTYVHGINDPAERVDIDTKLDFELARYILENNLYPLAS